MTQKLQFAAMHQMMVTTLPSPRPLMLARPGTPSITTTLTHSTSTVSHVHMLITVGQLVKLMMDQTQVPVSSTPLMVVKHGKFNYTTKTQLIL